MPLTRGKDVCMPLTENGRPQVYAPMVWRSFAKVNLYLDVLHKRRDGYHNIETIFQTVNLYDELTFLDDGHLSMTCSGAELDTGTTNLVYRAALLLQEQTGCTRGARIHLEKRIPIAAGLAGGSGNAAATLAALNKLWDLRLPLARLGRFARVLGSDVPYCLHGGAMAGTLRGEALYPLPPLNGIWFVLVHPPAAVSAAHVYNDPLLGLNMERPFAGRTPSFRAALRALREGAHDRVIFNRMERPVFEQHPTLVELKDALLAAGCPAAAMSGSGPTLFGICKSQREALRVADFLKEEALDCRTSIAAPVPAGIEWIR